MDPVTAVALVTAILTATPEIIVDVEKLVEALRGAPAAPAPPPLAPQIIAAMKTAYEHLLAAQEANK
jgi:hypothetical protein